MSSSYKKSLFKQKTYGSALQSGSHRLLSHQSSENEESSTIYSSSQWRYNKNNPYSQWHGSQRGSRRALGEDEAEDEWDFGSTWNPESIPLLQRTIGMIYANEYLNLSFIEVRNFKFEHAMSSRIIYSSSLSLCLKTCLQSF